jgi:hypothetical protein
MIHIGETPFSTIDFFQIGEYTDTGVSLQTSKHSHMESIISSPNHSLVRSLSDQCS